MPTLFLHIRRFAGNPVIRFFTGVVILYDTAFAMTRLLLLLTAADHFQGVPAALLIKSFWVGARFDTAITLYVVAPLFLLNYLFYFREAHHRLQLFNRIYLLLFFGLFSFLGLAETEFFKYFHVRLNTFFVNWEANPGFILKMVWETYPVVWYLLILTFWVGAAAYLLRWWENRCHSAASLHSFTGKLVFFLIVAPLLFIGIRGTVSYKTPLRWGHAYFSSYNSANQLALNGIFNLISDLTYQRRGQTNPAKLFGIADRAEAYRIVRQIAADSSGRFLKFPLREYRPSAPPQKLNLVIFLLESYSQAGLDQLREQGVSLAFDQLKEKGIYFPNFYSDGFHTYMGLFTSLFGMPNIYAQSILKSGKGQQVFSGLLNLLTGARYYSLFGVPHDPNFDNMAGFLRGNGLQTIVSQFDFPQSEVLSTLGVADHRLFEEMNQRFRKTPEPFVGVILSSNNHGPWIIPRVEGKEFVSTLHYTDWALGYFLKMASREEYFKNTLFVITGDHGKALDPGHELNLQNTHIPCLIYNPGLLKPAKVKTVAGHLDLSQTLLGLLNISYRTTALGRDILNLPGQAAGRAFMQEGKLLGMVTDDWYCLDRLGGRVSLYRYRSDMPLTDHAEDFPALADSLSRQIRAFYYVGNDLILNQQVAPAYWERDTASTSHSLP